MFFTWLSERSERRRKPELEVWGVRGERECSGSSINDRAGVTSLHDPVRPVHPVQPRPKLSGPDYQLESSRTHTHTFRPLTHDPARILKGPSTDNWPIREDIGGPGAVLWASAWLCLKLEPGCEGMVGGGGSPGPARSLSICDLLLGQ